MCVYILSVCSYDFHDSNLTLFCGDEKYICVQKIVHWEIQKWDYHFHYLAFKKINNTMFLFKIKSLIHKELSLTQVSTIWGFATTALLSLVWPVA